MKPEEIQYKITQLHFDNQSAYSTRGRIRAIMNGGPDGICLLYTSPSPRDGLLSRMPSSA